MLDRVSSSIEMLDSVGACPVCDDSGENGSVSRTIAIAADASGSGFPDFRIKACQSCGMGSTSPIPSPTTAGLLYADRLSANFDGEGGHLIGLVKDWLARRFLRRLTAGRQIRRVLDYSTGNGRYAAAAACVLPHATIIATDTLAEPPEALRETARVHYIKGASFDDDPSLALFDLIILRHVLEHTYTPREQLAALRDRLSPGGEIYIEVPNLRCTWAPLAGKFFPGYYAPYHVFHFERTTLTRLLQSVGLAGEIEPSHMPMVGNIVSRRWGCEETFLIKLFGISLFPIQVLLERLFGNASAIAVRARRTDDAGPNPT